MELTERDQARFWSKVALPDGNGCMLWLAYVRDAGYGEFRLGSRMIRAHRVSYVLAYGPIPDGLVIDHVCRVRQCVAPEHLEPVTNRENLLRGESPSARWAARTHCEQGHAFSTENTYRYPAGHRACRTCSRKARAERTKTDKRRSQSLH